MKSVEKINGRKREKGNRNDFPISEARLLNSLQKSLIDFNPSQLFLHTHYGELKRIALY